jgi:phospholipase C
MPTGRDRLKHIVVLMMENRSFDHMLGGLKVVDGRIQGISGTESNLDTKGEPVIVKAQAQFQSQLDPDPNHYFDAVYQQLFDGDFRNDIEPTMAGFVKSYYEVRRDLKHSRLIMNYFKPEKLPVLTTLAREFAVFNGWFSSIPGPTLCNRAFAHYGTSFGHVDMTVFYTNTSIKSVYQRLNENGKIGKIYYFDQISSTMEIANLLQHQPQYFGLFSQFEADCESGTLPDYSFIEPNFTDHEVDGVDTLASDQHPDHDVREGERLIARVYNALKHNAALWESTALLITYDEHGGLYDHVPPPKCTPDGFVAQPDSTKIGKPFRFDRLGVRVPAILVSPWVARRTVVPGAGELGGRIFEHASIPATVTELFIGNYNDRTVREKQAERFLDLLTLDQIREDTPDFVLD